MVGRPWSGWVALPLLSAAVVSGEALTAMTFGLCAWGAVRLVSGWCFAGGAGLTLAQVRSEADRACARGRFDEAKRLYERAILIAEQRQPVDARAVVRDYYNLAATTAMLGEHRSAARVLLRLRPHLRCVDGTWAEHAAWMSRYVAGQLIARGEVPRCVALVELSLDLLERAREVLEPGERATALKEAGWVLMYAGRLDAAELAFRAALEGGRGDDECRGVEGRHQTVAPGPRVSHHAPPPWAPYRGAANHAASGQRFEPDAARLGLAECHLSLGRLVEARVAFEEMRAELCPELCGPDFAGRVLRGLGRTEAGLGNRRAAEELLHAAFAQDQAGDRSLGGAALDLTLLADLYVQHGELARAAELVAWASRELGRTAPRGVALELEAVKAAVEVAHDPAAALLRVDATMAQADHLWGGEHPNMIPLLGLASEIAAANGCLGLAERRLGRARILARRLDATHPLHARLARVSRRVQQARSDRARQPAPGSASVQVAEQ